MEDLRSQVEYLQSEIMRVREDKQEEEERLHEVISTLQAELATLGPNLHEVSDSQDGDSINPSPALSPEPHLCTIQEQERSGEPNSLKQELNLTHSASIRSLQSRVKALQSQLEVAVAEKEGLERLLLTQEEEYRGHGEEFEIRLKDERERVNELQGLLILKEAELEDVKEQIEQETEKRKLSEEERDSCKVQAEEARALHEKNNQLSSLIVELQKKEQESLSEIQSLQTKEQEMKIEMEALRETSLTLERQVQEVRAEVVDMEELVAEERTKIQTFVTARGELSTELKCREAQLQEEIERFRQEVTSLRTRIQDLTVQLNEKETIQEEAQKEVLVSNFYYKRFYFVAGRAQFLNLIVGIIKSDEINKYINKFMFKLVSKQVSKFYIVLKGLFVLHIDRKWHLCVLKDSLTSSLCDIIKIFLVKLALASCDPLQTGNAFCFC